jgi:hypothetical protein
MGDLLAGLGWLVAGGTFGIVLMCAMFLSKKWDLSHEEIRGTDDGRSHLAR